MELLGNNLRDNHFLFDVSSQIGPRIKLTCVFKPPVVFDALLHVFAAQRGCTKYDETSRALLLKTHLGCQRYLFVGKRA